MTFLKSGNISESEMHVAPKGVCEELWADRVLKVFIIDGLVIVGTWRPAPCPVQSPPEILADG